MALTHLHRANEEVNKLVIGTLRTTKAMGVQMKMILSTGARRNERRKSLT